MFYIEIGFGAHHFEPRHNTDQKHHLTTLVTFPLTLLLWKKSNLI